MHQFLWRIVLHNQRQRLIWGGRSVECAAMLIPLCVEACVDYFGTFVIDLWIVSLNSSLASWRNKEVLFIMNVMSIMNVFITGIRLTKAMLWAGLWTQFRKWLKSVHLRLSPPLPPTFLNTAKPIPSIPSSKISFICSLGGLIFVCCCLLPPNPRSYCAIVWLRGALLRRSWQCEFSPGFSSIQKLRSKSHRVVCYYSDPSCFKAAVRFRTRCHPI